MSASVAPGCVSDLCAPFSRRWPAPSRTGTHEHLPPSYCVRSATRFTVAPTSANSLSARGRATSAPYRQRDQKSCPEGCRPDRPARPPAGSITARGPSSDVMFRQHPSQRRATIPPPLLWAHLPVPADDSLVPLDGEGQRRPGLHWRSPACKRRANFLDLNHSRTGHRPCASLKSNRKTSRTDNFPFKEEQSAKTAAPSLLALLASREHLRGSLSDVPGLWT
jgi:hypothetical protein